MNRKYKLLLEQLISERGVLRLDQVNPSSMGIKPISFTRQVTQKVLDPLYPCHPEISEMAQQINTNITPIGSYSENGGFPYLIDLVQKGISKSLKKSPRTLLCNSVAQGIAYALNTFIQRDDGVILLTPYESINLEMVVQSGGRPIIQSKLSPTDAKILVVQNRYKDQEIRDIIEFASQNKLILIVDEQLPGEFGSFNMVYQSMNLQCEGIVFNEVFNESGMGCGYYNFIDEFSQEIYAAWYKMGFVHCFPNSIGQLITALSFQRPKSPELLDIYQNEVYRNQFILKARQEDLQELTRRIYNTDSAYIPIHLTQNQKSEAQRLQLSDDEYYCFRLASDTGIVALPGQSYGLQNTIHFSRYCGAQSLFGDKIRQLQRWHSLFK